MSIGVGNSDGDDGATIERRPVAVVARGRRGHRVGEEDGGWRRGVGGAERSEADVPHPRPPPEGSGAAPAVLDAICGGRSLELSPPPSSMPSAQEGSGAATAVLDL